MRILHVNLAAAASPVDGIGVVVATLTDAQRAAGHTVSRMDTAWREGRSAPRAAASAVSSILRSRPDIVHLHSVYRPLHAVVVAACIATATPYVISPHSGLAPAGRLRRRRSKAAWIAVAERPMLRRAGRVGCLSAVEAADVGHLVPQARTAVVPNPVVLPRTPSPGERTVPGGRSGAVTLSRFDVYQKGLDRLMDLARAVPEMTFDVYGALDRNDAEAARTLISTAPGNVHFRPPVHGIEKLTVLAAADVYVQLSRWEGQSLAVLEAMAAGTPCLVSPYVAQTLGSDGGRRVIAVPEVTDAAAAVLRAVVADPQRRVRLATAAAAWVRTETDPAAIVQQLDVVYADAISAARPRTQHRRRRIGAGLQARGAGT